MLRYPFNGDPILTNGFRDGRWNNPHYGEDYAMAHRTAILAITSGTVDKVQDGESRNWLANTKSDPYKLLGYPLVKRRLRMEDYGNFVKLYHGKKGAKDIHSLYAHLDEVTVYPGQHVEEGEVIGYSDNTGNSTGNHLHCELRVDNKVTNPDSFDMGWEGTLKNLSGKFYHTKQLVSVADWVNKLNVRKQPNMTAPEVKQPTASGKLHAGDTFEVIGFVQGEEVKYEKAQTDLWWVSKKGNYVWSGGTNQQPLMEDTPEPVIEDSNNLENSKKGSTMEGLKAKLEELMAGREEVEERIASDEKSRDEFTMDIAKVKEEISAMPAEVVVEEVPAVEEAPVVEEAVKAPEAVEEAPVAEEVVVEGAEAAKKDYYDLLATAQAIKEKFGL